MPVIGPFKWISPPSVQSSPSPTPYGPSCTVLLACSVLARSVRIETSFHHCLSKFLCSYKNLFCFCKCGWFPRHLPHLAISLMQRKRVPSSASLAYFLPKIVEEADCVVPRGELENGNVKINCLREAYKRPKWSEYLTRVCVCIWISWGRVDEVCIEPSV